MEASSIFGKNESEEVVQVNKLHELARSMEKGLVDRFNVDLAINGSDWELLYQTDEAPTYPHGRVRMHINNKLPFLNGFFQQVGASYYHENDLEIPGNTGDNSFYVNVLTGEVYSGSNPDIICHSCKYDINAVTYVGKELVLRKAGTSSIKLGEQDELHTLALPVVSTLGDYKIEKLTQCTYLITSEVREGLNVEVNVNQIYQYNELGLMNLDVLTKIADDFLVHI